MSGIPISFVLLAVMAVAAGSGRIAFAADDHDAKAAKDATRKLEDTPKLTVRGDVELKKPADQLRLRVGVVTEHREAAQALDANNTRMLEVVEALKRVGLSKDEYETGRFRVRPNYSRRPRQASPEWKPQIVGYEVVNDVLIKTHQLDMAGEIIEETNRVGANTIEVLGFTLAKPRTYRGEAIAGATKNALSDAKALAEAAGLDLVRILSIQLDQMSSPVSERMMQRGGMAMAADGGSAPPITPGDVTIRAGVTIVYEIAPTH